MSGPATGPSRWSEATHETILRKSSYATTLGMALNSTATPSRQEQEAVIARRTTHNGMPAVIFKAKDYYGVMADECKRTLVGRFLKIRPQIDKFRAQFSEKFALEGTVKIGVYGIYNVFLDFINDEDFDIIRFKRVVEIAGAQMWLQKWTSDFKPDEDLPIATIWALLPKLPFHMHTWHYAKQVIGPAGTPLELDIATKTKTRPSMAKVRVEIDLLKPLHTKLGHSLVNCWAIEKLKQEENKEKKNESGESSKGKQNEEDINRVEIQEKETMEETNWQVPNTKRNRKKKQSKARQENQKVNEQALQGSEKEEDNLDQGNKQKVRKNDQEIHDQGKKQTESNENDQVEKKESIEPDIVMRNIKNTKKKQKMPKKKRSINFKPSLGSSKRNISKSSIRKQINTLDTIVEDSLKELENMNINKDKDDYTKDDSNAIDTEAEIKPNNTVATNGSKEQGSSTKEKTQYSESVNMGDQHESNKQEVSNTKSSSLPSEIENHPGIQVVVDLGDYNFQDRAVQINTRTDEENCKATILADEEQQVTIHLKYDMYDPEVYITAVYAKCTSVERKDLWGSLENIHSIINGPWCIGGYFNVIMDPDEKLGGKTLDSSHCRVVYITRNPKDTLVSMWHFTNKWKNVEDGPWPLEEAIEKFCAGIFPGGPYYDHVMGFKTASLVKPKNIFFITYEELLSDPNTHVKRLAEFLGCPFDREEEVEEVVKSCSFDILSSYEVNKSEDFPSWFQVPYNSFFRQGVVGDHKNYLNAMTIERIDAFTRDKFHGAGFIYGI
ncbi:cytosolic sulfotransferase 12 [Nicotiana attenuata]|uniref:Cytosolic sulfotransferase 12 n=1 Tax=Nicotiana attenuata TaxID=49451 RepID=A0A314LB69_NICAT|nr:cytosolic sulfotransferase 12 [Nicotiana attenuata]